MTAFDGRRRSVTVGDGRLAWVICLISELSMIYVIDNSFPITERYILYQAEVYHAPCLFEVIER